MLKKLILGMALVVLSMNTNAAMRINAAGASFPYAIYSKWFSEYSKLNKNVVFNYQPTTSAPAWLHFNYKESFFPIFSITVISVLP